MVLLSLAVNQSINYVSSLDFANFKEKVILYYQITTCDKGLNNS